MALPLALASTFIFRALSSGPIGWNFDQTCIDTLLGEGKEVLRFGDLDLIFKVTLVLGNVQNMVSMRHLLN